MVYTRGFFRGGDGGYLPLGAGAGASIDQGEVRSHYEVRLGVPVGAVAAIIDQGACAFILC